MSSPAPDRTSRRTLIQERDGDTCAWCGRPFSTLVRATTEHVVPRVKGGPSWLENEVLACRRCNGERGHQSPTAWLEECVRRGWEPDRARLLRALGDLERTIRARGGQRRARPYLARELRRLNRLG